MEIKVNSIIIGIGIYAIILLILGLAARKLAELYFKLKQKRERRELHFEELFMRVQFILSLEPTEKRMNELLALIKQLEGWNNLEKVNMVKSKFFADYEKLFKEILSQDEFAPENVFKN
jgi:hypothetical protein